jgi:hypothetical protein
VKYWNAEKRRWQYPSTATSYAWIVWPGKDFRRWSIDIRFMWIPPCRKSLERPGDYPEPEPGPGPEAMTLLAPIGGGDDLGEEFP